MAKIISISIPKDAEPLIDELSALSGSLSSHVVEAIRQYLKAKGDEAAPFWYIPGKDYSHLPAEMRQKLTKFGYVDVASQKDPS